MSSVDPIELLCQLTMLYQTHGSGEIPNRDEHAQWQVRIEWLAWLILGHGLIAPPLPRIIDGQILGPLEELLAEYFAVRSLSVFKDPDDVPPEQHEFRLNLLMEALHVRGEGFFTQIRSLAEEVYGPHDGWCAGALGLTAHDAFSIAGALNTIFGKKLFAAKEESDIVYQRVLNDPSTAKELDGMPASIQDVAIPPSSDEGFARTMSLLWFFSHAKDIIGFTDNELRADVDGNIKEKVPAFLELVRVSDDDAAGEPNPFHMTPLAKKPLVKLGDRFFLFVPGTLYQGVFYAFHFRMLQDEDYKNTYDNARAEWLEHSAIEVFRGMLPSATPGWSLQYGPKKQRAELDGLIKYDNKIVLIECKWKNPTLLALQGDVEVALRDFKLAILDPLAQAKRARDYIRQQGTATFTERRTGKKIVVHSADISEVFLVTLVGGGAWGQIAANLAELAPLGFFSDGEYPWALSILDLRVVAEWMELPSQLFDYLRRRFKVQQDPRFKVHDEWDLLAVYLAGALDVDEPQFQGVNLVWLSGFDTELQDYLYSRFVPSAPPVPRPRREIPENILELLKGAERADHVAKTDAICAVLAWPDPGLADISAMLKKVRGKAILDGKAHGVSAKHPWKDSGVSFAYGYGNRRAIQDVLLNACQGAQDKTGATEWVGFGVDLADPDDAIVYYFNSAIKQPAPRPG